MNTKKLRPALTCVSRTFCQQEADFLGQGSCRFALGEARSERGFAARAEAIGLRYNVATRIEGYNISQGKAISIAIFRSEGTE